MQYQADLITNCVAVSGDTQTDTDATNELLGGLTHSAERFSFDISGVDIEMTDNSLAADNVIRDTDIPGPTDTCTDFDIDQETLGGLLNDLAGNVSGAPLDLHMTGLVYAEYLNSIQAALNATLPPGQQPTSSATRCASPARATPRPPAAPASRAS